VVEEQQTADLSVMAEPEPEAVVDSEPESETVIEVVAEPEPELTVELDSSDNDFGVPEQEEVDLTGENDLFLFGESQHQGLLDALDNGVQQSSADQGWFSQVEEDQSNNDSSNLGDFDGAASSDDSGYTSDDDQPCEW
jgi:hypothetical protein